MTPNREYWRARALRREQEAYLRGVELDKRLFAEYQAAAVKLKRSIRDFYARYGTKHGLTYEEAVRKLTGREMREWKAALGEYVAAIRSETDPGVRAELTAQLDALSANSQISRLEALLADVQAQMDHLYDRCRAELADGFGEIYAESYYRKHYDLQSRAGRMEEIAKLTPGMIEDAVSYPWSGAMFSDRLWKNKDALLFNLREIVTQSLVQGRSLPETSKALSDKLGQSYKAAERLVRTETSHLHNRADLAAYAAAGITEYEYMATLDARTCEVCGALDGRHFPVKDAMPGVNFPPMHPNDRCTTVEYDPEDAADRKASGGRMLEGMTYAAWRKKQFTYSAASGIMTSGGDEMHIEIEIDRFTPCLLDRDTGQLVDTDYRLVSKAELAQTKKQGWLFNWTHKSLSGSDVYKLCVKGSGEIQGLVAVEDVAKNSAFHVSLAESAPWNKGDEKRFEGVGGHLFAIAAQKSLEAGYGGFIYFEAKNRDLVEHYREKFGAQLIRMRHKYSMIIDEESAQALLDAYTLGEGD